MAGMGDTLESQRAARDSRAIALFGTWMLIGLFVDGWAHGANKPETFFSPWHGILYSGFVAAVLWFAWDGRRRDGDTNVDRLAQVGLGVFVVGAVGDGVWHQVFGIEVDIEALLSPTHLALMVGGALMVTAPFRVGWRWLPERPSFRQFFPTLASATLVTSLVLFFLMYLTASNPIAQSAGADEDGQGWGIASVLIRTALMLAPTLLILRRWTPPAGSFTLLFSVTALALAGLDGFEAIALAAPFVVGGVAADVIVARGLGGERRSQVVGLAVPMVCWLSYFAIHAAIWGVHWPAEIWTGAVVLAALTGFGLALLTDGLAGRSVTTMRSGSERTGDAHEVRDLLRAPAAPPVGRRQ
jgi:hypothetical protein